MTFRKMPGSIVAAASTPPIIAPVIPGVATSWRVASLPLPASIDGVDVSFDGIRPRTPGD